MTAESLVLEPDGLPEVALKAAPWQLHGSGYALMMRLPAELIEQHAFVPPSLAGKRRSRTAFVLYMDYQSSDGGPYRELLVIPASFDFEPGTHLSITRIYVSSYDSVVNGRRNWGIPKDYADFDVQHVDERVDRVTLSRAGHVFADMKLRNFGLTVPVHSGMLPGVLRLNQHWQDKVYGFTLRAKGKARLAKVLDWHFDPNFFPDLAQGRVIAGAYLPSFDMTFPMPTVRDLPTAQARSARTNSSGSVTT